MGDTLPLGKPVAEAKPTELPAEWMGAMGAVQEDGSQTWTVGVLPGPHADPDFLMPTSMETFYSSPYQVHYNSNRCACPLPLVVLRTTSPCAALVHHIAARSAAHNTGHCTATVTCAYIPDIQT